MGTQPNIVFIMADDHASHAMSCYSSVINKTPNIDRIANEGMRLDQCFCTNSLCCPSRASILTGTYSHINDVKSLKDTFDGRKETFVKLLQSAGYQTAMIGKWHLGHGGYSDPTGFDYWNILPGQGRYHNPSMIENGVQKTMSGYVTDVVTDLTLEWMKKRDKQRPFFVMCHHKAPHYPYETDEKHAPLYERESIKEPPTLHDAYQNRASAARAAKMRVDRDIPESFFKGEKPPAHLDRRQTTSWYYQKYIKAYLRCVASIDDNVGRILDFLDEEALAEDTILVYTSDQGFFLGDHGWYDKRFMYEESIKMPFVIRYPKEIKPLSTTDAMCLNLDFGPTFLEYAGLRTPALMQGESMRSLLKGRTPQHWRKDFYYRYWMFPNLHDVYAHNGIRTHRYKLIQYIPMPDENGRRCPQSTEWECFDLDKDPMECHSIYHEKSYQTVVNKLKSRLFELKRECDDDDDSMPNRQM